MAKQKNGKMGQVDWNRYYAEWMHAHPQRRAKAAQKAAYGHKRHG